MPAHAAPSILIFAMALGLIDTYFSVFGWPLEARAGVVAIPRRAEIRLMSL